MSKCGQYKILSLVQSKLRITAHSLPFAFHEHHTLFFHRFSFFFMCDLLNQSIYLQKFIIISRGTGMPFAWICDILWHRMPLRCSALDKQTQLIENYLFILLFCFAIYIYLSVKKPDIVDHYFSHVLFMVLNLMAEKRPQTWLFFSLIFISLSNTHTYTLLLVLYKFKFINFAAWTFLTDIRRA